MNKFKDVHRVSPAANYFDKNGRYCPFPPNTQPYYEFWDKEKKRCLEGYTTEEGDITVTGYHYFYLNYCPIQIAVDKELPDGTIIAERKQHFPKFYDKDHEYFTAVDECRRTNKHLTVLKGRRKGYSYKSASMLNRNYFHIRGSKNFVFAGMKEYLTGVDAILTKAWEMMNFIDDNTAWTQPRLLDRPMEKTSGYKKRVNGQFIQKGLLSSIAGVSLKDDSDKVRGKAGELVFFEEAGAFPELLDAWNVAMPTMRQGSKTLGTMIAFGTGGTEGTGFESLDELFYHPESYDCLEFDNIWSDSGFGTKCGFFVPIYDILDGFIDEHGNSLIEKAKAFELGEREKKRQGNDPKSYDKYLAEHPFTPEEATLQSTANLFNQANIKAQLDRVKAKNLHTMGVPGELIQEDSKVSFKANWDLRPVVRYPHRTEDDLAGCVVMYETPFKTKGEVPDFLYYICHDPYAHDKSSSSSLGSAYVIKRPNRISQPDDMIVASYVGRPNTQDEYNSNLFRLSILYNAKIGFENDRGDVIGYAKRFRLLHRLQPEFEMLQNKELQSKTVKRGFGMHMTETRKRQGELYLRDWLESQRGRHSDDTFTLNVNKIYDVALLQELLKFNHQGNFDRAMSLIVGMFMMQEMFNSTVKEKIKVPHQDWFDGLYEGNKTPLGDLGTPGGVTAL